MKMKLLHYIQKILNYLIIFFYIVLLMNNNIINDNLKINNLISYGMKGTVYNAEYNNKFYAYKIEHILKSDINKQKKEINFSLKFANKYPLHFIYLHDFKFINNCNHKQQYSFNINDFPDKQYYIKLAKSNLCVAKIFSLVDGTLDNIFSSLNTNQLYSLYIQITYILFLLHKHKFSHNDIHPKNIGFIKTNKDFINIFNLKIPTFGYIFKLIDFGEISHINNNYPELFSLLYLMFDLNINNFNINWSKSDKLIFNTSEFKIINQHFNYKFLSIFLFSILHNHLYYKFRIKKIISPTFFISSSQIINIIFFMNNLDFKNIISYLLSLITFN
jgi:hypothetical protein